ncbi:SPOSA6832_01045 [Sporobolomyces salmonicolor]|uniref:SPOSA6832_01045-mRNA-1:cds n=1 Tax=Sporidiobolus salmonicolor TaxID=5005 RepID=A0A0D6EIR5_SPOSA|nr:SPOSA6832_01045 [Sporobolomyces salmonicolor]
MPHTISDGILPVLPALDPGSALPSPEDQSDLKIDHGYIKSESEASSVYDASKAPLAPRKEEPGSPGDAILRFLRIRKRREILDLDAVATQESVYDGPLASYYAPHPKWENLAAFDPSFRWTHREERRVVRKSDFYIFGWIMLMFLALDIDRGNMANATADNLLSDLGLTQGDYNLGNTLSKLGCELDLFPLSPSLRLQLTVPTLPVLIAELPSQMIGKKLGVDVWLPMQMCMFSVLAFAQFWMQGRASFLALRFMIAFFQGGFIPDVILYLSYYFTKTELPIRLAFFWSINYFTNTLTAFLAVGLLKMRGVGGYAGWRWMFLIEGLFTLVVGILSFVMLPPGPSQTKNRLRPKGYYSDREVKIIVNRVVRDDPGKASMHNRQALTPALLWKSLKDYDMYPMYLIGLLFGIPGYPVSNYFQISMSTCAARFDSGSLLTPAPSERLGFSTVMSNLLSVPNTVISIILLLIITVLSEVVNSRTWVAILENVWFLPFFIVLRVLPDPISPWTYFAIATLLLGFPYAHALQVSWTSRNAGSVRTRTVSASWVVQPSSPLKRPTDQPFPTRSVYNIMVQLSAIIGANLYEASDAPRYNRGNSIILGIIAFNLVVLYPGTYFYYKARNAHKAKRWDAMTEEQQAEYLDTTKDEGSRRLDFRFVY